MLIWGSRPEAKCDEVSGVMLQRGNKVV